jgi:hypothetical protein
MYISLKWSDVNNKVDAPNVGLYLQNIKTKIIEGLILNEDQE